MGSSNAYSAVCASKSYGEGSKRVHRKHSEKNGHSLTHPKTKVKKKNCKLADEKYLLGKILLTNLDVPKIKILYGLAIRRNCYCLPEMKQTVWAIYYLSPYVKQL